MKQKELDELLCEVLLHSSKTTAFLKRLRASQPDKWQRVFGNVSMAYHMLAPREVKVPVFSIGVFDPTEDDRWPWRCDYEDGVYLSEKFRLCKRWKAARFSTELEAREFFHRWNGKRTLKMEVIEFSENKILESYI